MMLASSQPDVYSLSHGQMAIIRRGIEMQLPDTYITTDGIIVCSVHCDESVMNKHDQCDECLDDAHERELMAR